MGRVLQPPHSVNDIKYHSDFNGDYLEEQKFEFLITWLQIGIQNPKAYIDAWLAMTGGYWNIDSLNWITAGRQQYNYNPEIGYQPDVELSDGRSLIAEGTGMVFFDRDVSEDIETVRDSWLLHPFYSIAFAAWGIAFLALAVTFGARGWRNAIPYAALLLLLGTVLIAAPVWCEFRYTFALNLCLPVMLIMAFAKTEPNGQFDKKSKRSRLP